MKHINKIKMFKQRIKRYFNNLSWQEKIKTIFSQPFLILALPKTYYRLYKNILRPKNKQLEFTTGFSKTTALILTWYLRVNECIEKYGRNGYVYEDGLGFSLKERFWLNPLALKIYGKLKIRNFIIITTVLFILSIAIIAYFQSTSLIFAIILTISIIGSSLFLISFFRFSKPEILSWALFPFAFYAFFTESYIIAGIIAILISFLNFTVTLLILETIILYSFLSKNLFNGFLISIIPILKLLNDLLPLLKSSLVNKLFEVLGGRKAKSRKDKLLKLRLEDVYLEFFYIIFISIFIIQKAPLVYTVLLINPLILFIINQKIFRYGDNNTFFRFFFTIATICIILHPTVLSFIFYLLFIYLSPLSLLDVSEKNLSNFPYLKPYSLEKINKLVEKFFNQIPNQSRIAFERNDTEKSMSGFRTILYYLEYILFKRGIEFLPMEWLRFTQLDYFMQEYIKINNQSNKKTIEEKFHELGVQYIIAHSPSFIENLKNWGYKEINTLNYKDIKKYFWGLKGLPEKNLVLFLLPFDVFLTHPHSILIRKPNQMKFEAQAKTEYIVKYTYHPDWQASQNGKKIPVYESKEKLSYLALKTEDKGMVELQFKTNKDRTPYV